MTNDQVKFARCALLNGWYLAVPQSQYGNVVLYVGPQTNDNDYFSMGIRVKEHGTSATGYIEVTGNTVNIEEMPYSFNNVSVDSVEKLITIWLDEETFDN